MRTASVVHVHAEPFNPFQLVRPSVRVGWVPVCTTGVSAKLQGILASQSSVASTALLRLLCVDLRESACS